MDRLIYQDLQERGAEEASTSGASFNAELLITNEQLAAERRSLQEVEQLLKSIDKVLGYLLPTALHLLRRTNIVVMTSCLLIDFDSPSSGDACINIVVHDVEFAYLM